MKRLVASTVVASVAVIAAFSALGRYTEPAPLKTIATVVAHAHHHAAMSGIGATLN